MCILILHYTSAGLAIIPLKRLHPSHIFGKLIDRSVDEIEPHSHTRGTMDITGRLGIWFWGVQSASGAFTVDSITSSSPAKYTGSNHTGGANALFKASNSWTGSTSEVGGGGKHCNLHRSVAVYAWRRQA